MNTTINLKMDISKIIGDFGKRQSLLRSNLLTTFTELGKGLKSYIINQKLSGQVLNRQSGKLQSSVDFTVASVGDEFTVSVFAGGDEAPYAIVHELGLTVNVLAHSATRQLKTYMVRAHQAKYPEKSFMRTTLEEHELIVANQMQYAVEQAMNLSEL
jgi:hypothetical protein